MSEFIGSRISLISKSDIKYVGTLHEINSETSTVALENVKSYGTEGRRGNADEEIPPNDQIYDYIVFRGSDVKDLTIVEPPKENKPPQAPQVPNDPAILGAARPHPGAPQPPQPFQQPPNQQWRAPQPPQFPPYGYPPPGPQQNARFVPPGGPHAFPGPGGAPPPGYGMQYGPPPGWFPPPGQGFPQGPPGQFSQQPIAPPGLQNPQKTPQSAAQQPFPQDAGRPAPPTGPEPSQSAADQPTPASTAPAGPPPPVDSKPDIAAATAPAQQSQPKAVPTGPRNSNRVALPLASPNVRAQMPTAPLQSKPGNAPGAQPAAAQSATEAAAAAVAAAMAKLGPVQGVKPAAGADGAIDNLTKKVGEMRTDDRIRNSRQPGTGGFAAGHRGGRGARRPSTREQTKPVDVPTTDFDFEGSNAKFNKQDLVKEAIASGSPMGTPTTEYQPHHEATDAGQDGEANGADVSVSNAEPDVVIPNATYNKSTSFFDNISSELKDRRAAQDDGKRVGGMEFRTQERSKNMETFGQGSVDTGFRGGFRGRARGRGFGRGGRGGFVNGRGAAFAPRGGPRGGRGGSGSVVTES